MLAAHWLCYYYQVRSTISLHLDRIRQKKGSYQKPPRSYNHSPRSISEHSLVPTLCTLHQGTQEVMHTQETIFNIFTVLLLFPALFTDRSISLYHFVVVGWFDIGVFVKIESMAIVVSLCSLLTMAMGLSHFGHAGKLAAAYCIQGARNILA